MFPSLLRRDPTLRAFGRWFAISSVAGLLLLNGVIIAMFKQGIDTLLFAQIVLYLSTSLYLIIGKAGLRCTRLDLALPISTREIWNSHLYALLLAGSSAHLILNGLLFLGAKGLGMLDEGFTVQAAEFGRLFLHFYGAILLNAVILSGLQPDQRSIRLGRTGTTGIVLVMLVVGAIAWLLSRLPLVAVMALPLAATLLAWAQARRIPTSLALAPREATGAYDAPKREGMDRGRESSFRFAWRLFSTVVLSTGKHPAFPWFSYPFLIAFGMLLSGFFSIWAGWGTLSYYFVIITAYSLFAFAGAPLTKFYLFDAVPISRRWLFATMVLPGMLALSLGYGVGVLGMELFAPRYEPFVYGTDKDSYGLRVPLDYWEIRQGDDDLELGGPGNETIQAMSLPFFESGKTGLFKPYTTGPQSSPAFVASQLEAAVLEFCGESPPADELESRYFRVDETGRTVLKTETLSVFADYPELQRIVRTGPYPYMMTWTMLILFASLAVYFRYLRPLVSDSRRKTAFVTILVVLLLGHMGQFGILMFSGIDADLVVAVQQIQLRHWASAFPGAEWLIWIAGAALVYAAYRLCERQFQRVELPLEQKAQREDG